MKSIQKVTYVLVLALTLPAAASSDSRVKVKCGDGSNYSTRNFKLVVCDFVNDSDSWSSLNITSFKFSDTQFPRILTADEAYTVATSYQSQELKSDYKKSLLMLVGIVGGAALMYHGMRSDNKGLSNSGLLITGAGILGQEYLDQKKRFMETFEGGGGIEKNQFVNNQVTLPPNMGSTRYFLIEVDPNDHYYITAELCYASETEVVTCTKQTIGEPKVKPDTPESRMKKRLGY